MIFAPWPGGTLDDLEQAVLKHLEGNPSAASKQFQGLLEDMLFLAWRRENRQRVLLFLGKQLEFCSKKPQLKEAARIICEELCLVSWASSMVDVEYYSCWVLGFAGWLGLIFIVEKGDYCKCFRGFRPSNNHGSALCQCLAAQRPGFRDEQSPLVLLCGFVGSHLDDLQPAIEHWTEKGFGVLAFGPARLGREDMLDLNLTSRGGFVKPFFDGNMHHFLLVKGQVPIFWLIKPQVFVGKS